MSAALGVVPTVGRETLSGLTLAGESLFVHAARTLANLPNLRTLLVVDDDWHDSVSACLAHARLPDVKVVGISDVEPHLRALGPEGVVVVHDPLCPLTPGAWMQGLLKRARSGEVLVATRPVVDTLKTTRNGVVAGTVDRTGLRILSSPTLVPVQVMVDEPELIALLADFAAQVEFLRPRRDVQLVEAPSAARRVNDPSDLELLAAEFAGDESTDPALTQR